MNKLLSLPAEQRDAARRILTEISARIEAHLALVLPSMGMSYADRVQRFKRKLNASIIPAFNARGDERGECAPRYITPTS